LVYCSLPLIFFGGEEQYTDLKNLSNRATNLNQAWTCQFTVTTSGTPEQLTVKKRAATIAFVDNALTTNGDDRDTITDSASGFLAAGFQPGDQLTVSGSGSNDGTYVIAAVTAGTITLNNKGVLIAEGAAAMVKLTAPKDIPDGVAVTIKAKEGNTGIIHIADSAAKALNTSGGSFTLTHNESVGLQVNNINQIYIDATVSGEGVEVILERNYVA
jgi:hypothetical protein